MFAVGTKVIDRDGFKGTITQVTEWQGSRWYTVRLPGGEAVRYDTDLRLVWYGDSARRRVGGTFGS